MLGVRWPSRHGVTAPSDLEYRPIIHCTCNDDLSYIVHTMMNAIITIKLLIYFIAQPMVQLEHLLIFEEIIAFHV